MSWGRGGRSADKPYSQAFETFVKPEAEDEDDVIGLLAYALYKQAIREDAIGGNATPGERRTPSDTTVQAYRGAARQLLTGVIDQAIADSAPAIQETALRESVYTVEANIKSHVDARTNWKAAVGTNLVAWLISLAIVFLVLVLARAPEVTDVLTEAVSTGRTSEQPTLPSPANGT